MQEAYGFNAWGDHANYHHGHDDGHRSRDCKPPPYGLQESLEMNVWGREHPHHAPYDCEGGGNRHTHVSGNGYYGHNDHHVMHASGGYGHGYYH